MLLLVAAIVTMGSLVIPVEPVWGQIAGDASLAAFAEKLPPGWSMRLEDGRLILERAGEVRIAFENRLNAPVTALTRPVGSAELPGKPGRTRLIFIAEPRQEEEQITARQQHNEQVGQQILALPREKEVSHLMQERNQRKELVLTPQKPGDEKRIQEYLAAKQKLAESLQKIPEYQSGAWWFRLQEMQGVEDGLHQVSPAEASTEAYDVLRRFGESFQRVP
jgi:hypothetical protein